MNITRLSWLNLIRSPFNTTLNLLLMMFGVGIISLLLLVNQEVERQLNSNLRGIDMVVGAKGSPLQLILSTVYHIDNPTGNITLAEANKLAKNSMVKSYIPISTGDSYKGHRIIGTNHDYVNLYEGELKEGTLWEKVLEVTIGSKVAEQNKLSIGSKFSGSHGLVDGGEVHDHVEYEVVGILNPSNSVLDNLVLTSSESVWRVHNHDHEDEHNHGECNHDHGGCNHDHEHDHHHENAKQDQDREITAMLVQLRNPIAHVQLPRMINEKTNMQAAIPQFEISRLTELLGVGIQTVNIIAFIIIIISGLSIFISLYNSMKKRRYELALMRVQGASKFQIVRLVLQEGLILAILGTVLGLVLSRLVLVLLPIFIGDKFVYGSSVWSFTTEEIWLFALTFLIGLLASIIPTVQSYKTDIAKTLIHG